MKEFAPGSTPYQSETEGILEWKSVRIFAASGWRNLAGCVSTHKDTDTFVTQAHVP
jgi:hypothetical protein